MHAPTPFPKHDPSAAAQPAPRRARPTARRCAQWLGALGALGLLAGCETVSLTTPAPIVVLHPQASAPAAQPAPVLPAGAASQPPAQAQGLQPTPGVVVQPLAPASTASQPALPASSPSSSPASSPASAAAPASAPSAPASLPASPASLPAASVPPGAVRYVCNDGTSFLATFGDVSVTMSTALGVLQLEQTVAADGARYSNGEVQVWFKGRQATISNLRSPGSAVLCLEQR